MNKGFGFNFESFSVLSFSGFFGGPPFSLCPADAETAFGNAGAGYRFKVVLFRL
jgi:hypothetical protein